MARRGFGSEADVYERSRPTYPAEAIAWLVDQACIGAGAVVADLAAGTGKLPGSSCRAERGSWPSSRCGRCTRCCAGACPPCRRRPAWPRPSRWPARRSTPCEWPRPSIGSLLIALPSSWLGCCVRAGAWRCSGTPGTGPSTGSTRSGRSWMPSRRLPPGGTMPTGANRSSVTGPSSVPRERRLSITTRP